MGNGFGGDKKDEMSPIVEIVGVERKYTHTYTQCICLLVGSVLEKTIGLRMQKKIKDL